MSDTTSIDDLPLAASVNRPGSENVVLRKSEAPLIYSPTIEGGGTVPDGQNQQGGGVNNIMNEVVAGVQRAGMSGLTMLPTRDIPMNPSLLMHDEQIRPNYIPDIGGSAGADYIKQHDAGHGHETVDGIVRNARRAKNREDTLETLYQEFQTPILLAMLYFAFQMPVVRANIMRFIPQFFSADGNLNLPGLVSMSIGFAISYYMIMKIINIAGQQ